ncbi:hypothetical protein B0J13DRAFT_646154 [Dactylonectria estremocensis]|uniref:Uncharacterized protein n=1 Tax=Dactylonectria estremocensis TaxID=1079267 RepID=A0A9P9IMJ5_9HYPO|nr:hypothetical protein B0J13DRAFT_646154 [Dactylonectria estremocensis]
METRSFTPSLAYIKMAAQDTAVNSHLQMGGLLGPKVFMVTGVKTASNITITTTEENKSEKTITLGVGVPAAQLTVGPKGSHESTQHVEHTRTIAGPILFAYEVEKIRVNMTGKLSHGRYINGAMLQKESAEVEYVYELAGFDVDEDEMEDPGITFRSGTDDETAEDCFIIIP